MIKQLLIVSVLLIVFDQGICQLSKIEKKIVNSIDSNNKKFIELLKESVNINSGSMNFEGVKRDGMLLKPYFEELGMEVNWVDGSAFNRAGHLIATIKGNKTPGILMIGHLDTVFEPNSPFQKYEMINDSTMKGPGVIDMKGGNLIILAALNALNETGLLKGMSIEVILIGDEEKSGSPLDLARKDLKAAAERADVALAFENGDGDPKTIVVTRRGSSGWKLSVTGNAAHSSQVFTEKVGYGAIYEASRILTEFQKTLQSEKDLTFNPGVFVGGTSASFDPGQSSGEAFGKTNVVAQTAIVSGDIRATSLEQLHRAKKAMLNIVSDHLPGTSAELTFNDGGYPPMAETEGNLKLLQYYSDVSEDLGYGTVDPVHPRNAGAADVSFTAGLVDMAIDGMGLSGDDAHTINETANLNMFPVQTKRAAILMYRLCYGKKDK